MADHRESGPESRRAESVRDSAVDMRISAPVLERVCKKMIEIILHCLPHAFGGSIYKVGPMSELRVVRVASGNRNGQTDEIRWGGWRKSDYDFPGKGWKEYRDRPHGILEAMGWCVERQKSWTADDPEHNVRSARKQLEGRAGDDYHHMEPVLVQKTDLWDRMPRVSAYPKDSSGNPIWQESPYATVAVIKIHFLPGSIKAGDRSTRIIKKLSQSLGTQMLSLHAREVALEKEKRLAGERLQTCNALAHEFRNLVPRIGFAYRIVNNEITYLRESWENLLYEHLPAHLQRRVILQELEGILEDISSEHGDLKLANDISTLRWHQNQLMRTCLLPYQNAMWLRQKIQPLWRSILSKVELEPLKKNEIKELLYRLRKSFLVGLDKRARDRVQNIREELKERWVDLAYREVDSTGNGMIAEYIRLLEDIDIALPRKRYSLRNFRYLKALLDLIPDIEEKLNNRLQQLKGS